MVCEEFLAADFAILVGIHGFEFFLCFHDIFEVGEELGVIEFTVMVDVHFFELLLRRERLFGDFCAVWFLTGGERTCNSHEGEADDNNKVGFHSMILGLCV